MKHVITCLLFCLSMPVFAQSDFPDFLQGTWKMEHKERYEHWDRLNEHTLKGFSYEMTNGHPVVTEYLELTREKRRITYTATVLNQNMGKGIAFRLTSFGSTFTFENPDHDFPKKIVYLKRSDTEVLVQVSGGDQRSFSYTLNRWPETTAAADSSVSNPNYDRALAEKLGADEYGMKGYLLVMLKTGSNKTTDRDLINASFRGHMENISRLVEDGTLIVAGPLGKNEQNYRGIFILNLTSHEEAARLMQTDLAIKNGLLDFELYNWYGSAALAEYLKYSDKIWKKNP